MLVLLLLSCGPKESDEITINTIEKHTKPEFVKKHSEINESANTLKERFNPPAGFEREDVNSNTFEYFLSNYKLKPHGSLVKYYNGTIKQAAGIYIAVLDIDVGKKDLQQCADAIMRLRGEYLYSHKKYDNLSFNFTSGFKCEYSKWKDGFRPVIKGNNVSWVKSKEYSVEYASFREYMDMVFMYAGTLSLSKELKKVNFSEMQTGDVLIIGGSPGHAVVVMDMAIEKSTGKKVYMLAQSYMPAQDIQLLLNPLNNSAWYELNIENDFIQTPEWKFTIQDLKRFV